MEKLTREEVLHVANLARIEIDEQEMERYQVQLKQILNEIEKIKDIEGYDDAFLIAPVDHLCEVREDEVGKMLTPEEVMKNVPSSKGNFVEVPVVINE